MVGRIHHATLRVSDVAEAAGRWGALLGLTGEVDGEVALLRCAYEDYALELRPAGSRAPGLEHVAYELRAGVSLAGAEERLGASEVECERTEAPGRGAALRLTDPDGNGVLLLERLPTAEEERWPAVARYSDTLPGFHPRKLGHVNYLTADTPRLVAF